MKEVFDIKFLVSIGTMLVAMGIAWGTINNSVSDALATDDEQNEKIEAIEDDLADIKSDVRVQAQAAGHIQDDVNETNESIKTIQETLNEILLNTRKP